MKRKFAGAAAALSLLIIHPFTPTRAATVYWGGGTGAITADNWYSDATLSTPTAFASGDAINLASGTLSIDGTATVGASNIGLGTGDNAAAIVTGTWNTATLSIGNGAGSAGALSILTGGTISATTFYVGNYGSGNLYIEEGAALSNSANAMLGRNGGSGTATIDGSWTAGTYIVLGYGAGSHDNLLIIGQTGTVKTTTYLRVGGAAANTSGSLVIRGLLDVTTNLAIGYSASGTVGVAGGRGGLYIAESGTVLAGGESALGYLGIGSSSEELVSAYGEATVDGVLIVNNIFSVGRSGDGVLTLNSTGTIFDTTGYVGRYWNGKAGHGHSTGTATVSGVWVNSADFYVADNGLGTLYLDASGTITAVNGFIGNSVNGTGTATVSGIWKNTDNLTIGSSGTGILDLQSGGSVIVGGTTIIGAADTGNGTLLLNGGVLETKQLAIGDGFAAMLINGGTLRAGANTDNFFVNFDTLDIDAVSGIGTVTFDTQAFSVTSTAALAGASPAVFEKLGNGTLILAADSSAYAGTVNVHGGNLAASGDNAKLGGQVNILSGGAIDLRSGALEVENITLADGATWRYSLTGTHALDVSGTLIFDGGGTFMFDRDTLAINEIIPGAYTLATYVSISGTDNLASWAITGADFSLDADAELDISSTPNKLKINIGSADLDFLYWQGGDGPWDAGSATWKRSGSPTAWSDGALGIFDTGTGTVDVAGLHSFYGLQFDDVVYTLGGTGTLTAGGTMNINTTVATGTAIINTAIEAASLYKTGPGTLTIGGRATFADTAAIRSGRLEVAESGTLAVAVVEIASDTGANVEAAVSVAGVLNATGTLVVGKNGDGLLTIGTTGTVIGNTSNISYLGYDASSSGTAIVHGYWDGGPLYIGSAGTGALRVETSGTVLSASTSRLGFDSTGVGSAVVHGYWKNASTLVVGGTGKGYVEVTETGTLINNNFYGADYEGSVAEIDVAGYWQSNAFVLGQRGTATLTIASTGTVIANGNTTLGNYVGAIGTMSVGGYHNNTGGFIIGAAGDGYFRILGGGVADTGGVTLGRDAGASGTAIIGGQWNVSGTGVEVGSNGNGALIIEENASLTVRNGTDYTWLIVGRNAGSYGEAVVRGLLDTGTRNNAVNATFYVGHTGIGVMTIESTGTVIASGTGGDTIGMTLGHGTAGSGTLTVAGILIINHGDAYIGYSGTGYLAVKETGTVTIGGRYKQNANSTLAVTLDPSRATAYITADSVSLSGTLALDGASFGYASVTKASDLTGLGALIITATSGGIHGNFTTVTGVDGSGMPDYLVVGGQVETAGNGYAHYYAGYRLAWNSPEGNAHGNFTLGAGETFEVDTPLADRYGPLSGGWDGKSLTKLGEGTLILSGENTFTGTLNVAAGTLRFGGPAIHGYGPLVNNGTVDFGNAATATFRTVNVTGLSGNGAFHMNVNPGTGESDQLVIAGAASGSHQMILIAADGSIAPTSDSATPVLATIGGANTATFTGGLDYNGASYAVAAAGKNIVLVTNGISGAYDLVNAVPGSQSVMWFASQDNLSRRIGELRSISDESIGKFSLWARARAENSRIGAGSNMRPFEMDLYGFEIGGDKTLAISSGRLTLGAYLGYGHAEQDFEPRANTGVGDGESDQLSLGIYAAWMHSAGWFANATLAAAKYDNTFTYRDASGSPTNGDYDDEAIGVSLEFGKRIVLDKMIGAGWFAEPSAQVSHILFMRDDYSTTGSQRLEVRGEDANISRMRATLKAGRGWKLKAGHLELSGRVGGAYEISSGGEVRRPTDSWRPNVDGARGEAGVGLIWRPTLVSQVYFDYEFATGKSYQKPWSISLGYRHAF